MKKRRPSTKKVDNPFAGCYTASEVKARFRELARTAHPDTGGTHEGFLALTAARDRALENGDACDLLEMGLERWPG